MKSVLLWLQRVFLLGSIGFLLYILLENRADISAVLSVASVPALALAGGFWIVSVLLVPSIAWVILYSRDNEIAFSSLFVIYINRIPAKYLPGGVWQTFARAYDMNSLGISKTDVGLVVFYENFSSVYLATLLSTFGIFLLDTNPLYSSLALLLFLGSLMVVPIAVLFRRQRFVLAAWVYAKLALICLVFWLCAASAFFFYLDALALVPPDYSPLLLMIHYQFSYVVGYASIFAPQGIGVFEVVMVELSEITMPAVQAVVLVAGFRVVVLVCDLLVWLVFVLTGASRSVMNINQ